MKLVNLSVGAAMAASVLMALPSAAASADAPPAARIVQTKIHLESGSRLFQPWTSGETWHYGEGFIEPLGLTRYWCGRNFKEQSAFPQPDYLRAFDKAFIGPGDGEMFFCVYRTNAGDLYAYDSPIGVLHAYDEVDSPHMKQTVNFVVGGTGAYAGATGIWGGVVEGRGKTRLISKGTAPLPEVLLKIMDGYIKIPQK